MKHTIAVFGSGTIKKDSRAWKEAFEAGFLLAKAGCTVMNGGYGGAMLASAEGAKAGGGKTIGITTAEFLGSKKNPFIDEEIRTSLWRKRLHQLIERADGFVVLDGGTGTLAELMVVWETLAKRLHRKPIVILGNRMRSLVQFLRRNPEVTFPRGLYLAKTPRQAVRFLSKRLGISPLL